MVILLMLLAFLLYMGAFLFWSPLMYAALIATALAGAAFVVWLWASVTGRIDPFPLCNRRR